MAIAATTGSGMADDQGAAEKGLDAIIVKVNPQTLPDQLRWRAVEDAFDQEAARPGDRHHDLGEVCRAPLRQGLQVDPFGLNGVGTLPIASGDQHVDEAPVVLDAGEVAASAQDQRLLDGRLEVPVLGFHRSVLVGLTTVVAAGIHTVMADEGVIPLRDVLALVDGQVAEG